MKLLPKAFGSLRTKSATLDSAKMHKDVFCNTVSMDRVTVAPLTTQGNDGTDRDRDTKNASNQRSEEKSDENNAS